MAFDNVPVPVENVIGEVGSGFKVKMVFLYSIVLSLSVTALI